MTVSIVMATYNRAATLPRAVASVLSQTEPDWELIIVDDGSTDETPALVAEMTDPRIRVYRHSPNRGVTAAKNAGLDRIRGEWFTTLDSDDEMIPDALAAMLDCAERTGATAIECNCTDTVTGAMSGIGPIADGWMTAHDHAQCRGEHWGLTRTELLGDMRFNDRLPGFESTLWLKIDTRAKRYYLHRALLIYHTEGADRICVAAPQTSFRRKLETYTILGEDGEYLSALKARVMRDTVTRSPESGSHASCGPSCPPSGRVRRDSVVTGRYRVPTSPMTLAGFPATIA